MTHVETYPALIGNTQRKMAGWKQKVDKCVYSVVALLFSPNHFHSTATSTNILDRIRTDRKFLDLVKILYDIFLLNKCASMWQCYG